MTRLFSTASAIAIAVAAPAHAEDPLHLGEITVYANKAGTPIPLDRTGATVDVVTEHELRQSSETALADRLSLLPGVSTSGNGGLGNTTTVRVRGLDGKYVKVLMDGIDITDPSSSQVQFNWAGMTNAGLSRVEVLKGSSSSVYGSRAVAGVINMSSDQRTGEPGTVLRFGLEGGTYDTYRAGFNVTTEGERGGLSFSVSRVQTDGFSSKAAGTEPDGYEGTQLNFSADIMATDTLTLGISGYALNSEGDFDEFDGDGVPPYDENNTTKTRALRAFAELATGAVTHTFSATYFNNDRVSSSNGFDTPFDGTRKRLDYTGVWDVSQALQFTFGGDWEREEFESGVDSGDADMTGIFAEALYAANDSLDLSASLRWDDHSEFGGNLSGRLAAAWRPAENTIVRAVAATGFRAPSLYELNHSLYGNPNLQPEESASFELGVEQQFGGGSFVKATAFYTEIDNLIQFVTLTSFPQPFTGEYQQVPGTSTSQGVELSGAWVLSDAFALYSNYTYTDAVDANGDRLLRVPGHDFVFGFSTVLADRWEGDLAVHYVADRPDEFGTVMEDYTVTDATISYALSETADAYLRIENIFDEQYQTSAGYNAPGRGFYVGLRAAF